MRAYLTATGMALGLLAGQGAVRGLKRAGGALSHIKLTVSMEDRPS